MSGVCGAQVTRGSIDYTTHCAKCHGALGKGKKNNPAIVGESALPLDPPPGAKLRTGQFRTAKDVLDFITANMPLHKGGKLKPAVYEAILAFDLKANGIDLGDKKLDPETAAQIKLHP